MSRKRCSVAGGLVFFTFTAFFGIAGHLLSELAGLGWQAGAELIVSARHEYLAVIALGALASLLIGALLARGALPRARVASVLGAMPFRGSGVAFAATAFVAQLAFCGLTQIAEGCPSGGGDILAAVIAACVSAALGAFTVTRCQRNVIDFAISLVDALLSPANRHRSIRSGRGVTRPPLARANRRTPFSFRYRPPPLAA